MISLLTVLVLSQAPQAQWTQVSFNDGYKLEQRPVKDSPFYEYRVTVDTDIPVESLCDVVYDWGTLSKDQENLRARRLLEDRGEVRVVYDQLAPPVVSERDYAFTVRRTRDEDQGQCRIEFSASNEKAPPKPEGFVRLEKLKGGWVFTRTPGGTHVVYLLFADPGGNLPAMLVHGSQREAAIKTVKKGLDLSRQRPRAQK
jgi:hypothetical protein